MEQCTIVFQCCHINHDAPIHFQKILSSYYKEFTYQQLIDKLQGAKEVGDEFTLLLASKWLRRNITVIMSKRDWSAYSLCEPDIIITYKEKDRFGRGKWTSSQLIGRGANTRSKGASKLIFLQHNSTKWVFTFR